MGETPGPDPWSDGPDLYYAAMTFQSLKGASNKANYVVIETGEQYWISGPRRDGADRLGEALPDEDVRSA